MPSKKKQKCSESTFQKLLHEALTNHGFIISGVETNGLLNLKISDRELKMNIENARRDYFRDGNKESINYYVESAVAVFAVPADWEDAKPNIRFSVEGLNSYAPDCVENLIADKITPEVYRLVVWVSSNEERITWITTGNLKDWGVDKETVVAAASENMGLILKQTSVVVDAIDNLQFGFFDTDSPLKSSLIFSPNLKEELSEKLGWPLFIVVPCRDFLYATSFREMVARFGSTVLREYDTSPYPVTTEVLKISDDGISAIGKFGA